MHRSTLFVALLFATAQASATEPSKKDVAAFAARTLDANCDKASPGMAVLLARGDEVLYRGACGSAAQVCQRIQQRTMTEDCDDLNAHGRPQHTL